MQQIKYFIYYNNYLMSSKADNFYAAPTPASQMLAQLGIDPNAHNSFNVNNQLQIGKQFNPKNNNNRANAYEDNQQQKHIQSPKQAYEDDQIPKSLNPVSMLAPPTRYIQQRQNQQPKGRKKETKKKQTKNKPVQQEKKKEIQINMDVDEVAEWGEKGTKANNNQDSFQGSEGDEKDQFDGKAQAQQDMIRKKIEEKIKKCQTAGSYSNNKNKNTLTSLKTKAEELKKKNQTTQQAKKIDPMPKIKQKQNRQSHNDSTQQILPKESGNNKKYKQQQLVIPKVESEMQSQSEDPWDKINEKTLAKKQKQKQEVKNAQDMNLNQFYEHLSLPGDDLEDDEEPQTGFFQSLCSCLKPKKKKLSDTQKQLLKLSKIQLSNSAEQIRLLKQIWVSLTNKQYLRFGEHWSEVGFQGRDPATDLRSTGILSLLQWNNFIHTYAPYDQQMLNFCTQFDIPLALTHIKVTSLVCSSIKSHLLEGRKWEDFQEWYNALTYYTFEYVMKNGKDRDQIGQLIEQAILCSKNNLQKAKTAYNQTLKLRK